MALDGPNGVNPLTQQQQYQPVDNTVGQNADVARVPVGGARNERPGLVLENSRQAQIDADFQASGLELTREQVRAERKNLGIGTTFPAKLVGNRGLNENRTIEIHNQYAKQIFTEGYGDDPALMNLAKQYIAELPKAARKGQERDYIAACETKLEAFRAAVRDYNLSVNQGIIDNNAQVRHDESELNANLREAQTQRVVAQTGRTVINQVNAHTDESNDAQTGAINANTNRVGNSVVRRVNAHTDEVGNKVIHDVNEHTDKVGNNVIRQVNQHTTAKHKQTRQYEQQQAVLDAKRQTMSDMLTNELSQGGTYQDSTVKWLGKAADRIMAATDLTFEQKKAALDELTRMIDEENVISDGDKNAFEATYFVNTTERPHL